MQGGALQVSGEADTVPVVDEDNAVARAIEMLGGLTAAVARFKVSSSTWARWRKQGWIDNPFVLLDVAAATDIPPERFTRDRTRRAS
jgi:hypothetical protein